MGIEASVLAAWALAAGAAAGAGATAYSAVSSSQAQDYAARQQKKAQDAAAAKARTEQRRSQQAMAAANRAEPDVAGIMGAAQSGAAGGPASTMLAGPTGVNPQELQLGRTSLLGG
jgi:hypothetical protein